MCRRVLPRKLTFKVIGVSGVAGDDEAILANGYWDVNVSRRWMKGGRCVRVSVKKIGVGDRIGTGRLIKRGWRYLQAARVVVSVARTALPM